MNQKPMLTQCRLLMAITLAMICAAVPAEAASENLKGTSFLTFVSANFSYDGLAPANLNLARGQDNLGGRFSSQGVSEYTVGLSCHEPDGSLGTEFDLLQLDSVNVYSDGQIFATASGPSAAHLCATAAGLIVGIATLRVTGGTGRFVNASGTLVVTFTGQVLVSGAASGGYGDLGSLSVSYRGTVAY